MIALCHTILRGRITSSLTRGLNWEGADAELVCCLPWAVQRAISYDRIFFTLWSVSHLEGGVRKLTLKYDQVFLATSKLRLKLTVTLHIWNGHKPHLCKGEKVHLEDWLQLLIQEQNWSGLSSSPWFTWGGQSEDAFDSTD